MKKKLFSFVEQIYCRFQDDEVSALGAQMTYYLILAFFPFLIFLLTILGYTNVTTNDILENISPLLPKNSYTMIHDFVTEILLTGNKTLLSIGMIGTIWASSSGVMAIIKGLNKAYDEAEDRAFWKIRGIALLFTLALGIVILIAFVLLIFGKIIGEHIFNRLSFPENFDTIWGFIKYGIPLTAMFIVFVFLYRSTPNRRLSYREVIPGSIFSTIGWVVTSILFAFYVNHWDSYTKTYGSIGGIIVLLIWLYISSIIILLGGEINAALYFIRHGKAKQLCKKFSLSLPFFNKKNK
jgi:membrane protein